MPKHLPTQEKSCAHAEDSAPARDCFIQGKPNPEISHQDEARTAASRESLWEFAGARPHPQHVWKEVQRGNIERNLRPRKFERETVPPRLAPGSVS